MRAEGGDVVHGVMWWLCGANLTASHIDFAIELRLANGGDEGG